MELQRYEGQTSTATESPMPLLPANAEDPVLTFYDETGERTALSADVLRGWVGRTANLLIQGCGLPVGARAAAVLSPHWQAATALLGMWSAGVSVDFLGDATAGLPLRGSSSDDPYDHDPYDVVFASAHRIGNWIDDIPPAPYRFVLGGGDASRDNAEGYVDYSMAVRPFTQKFDVGHSAEDAASVDGTTYAEWARLAREIARRSELRPGDRVLVDTAEHGHPAMWLLAPLSVGASVVVCGQLDQVTLDARVKAERITRIL